MIRLKGFTIAVTNMNAMVRFYNRIFDAKLEPFQLFGTTLYRGKLAGYTLTFCPNTLLAIKAEKNRQQFAFYVDDLASTIEHVRLYDGGQIQEIIETNEGKSCGVTDPDGNSIELTELAEPNAG